MRARVLLSEPVGLLDYSIPEGLDLEAGVPVRVWKTVTVVFSHDFGTRRVFLLE